MTSVAPDGPRYSAEPADPQAYTAANDRLYRRFARVYDVVVKAVPLWRRWIGHALPEIRGPRVLEVSFGTGWLLTQYAGRYRTDGVDLNPELIAVARRNLARARVRADLVQGSVEALPYPDATFDTVVNTMAFTGYPDAPAAAAELARVLKPGGRLVLIDINYPGDANRLGTVLVDRFWKPFGDIIRDVAVVLSEAGLDVARRRDRRPGQRPPLPRHQTPHTRQRRMNPTRHPTTSGRHTLDPSGDGGIAELRGSIDTNPEHVGGGEGGGRW